MPKSSLFNKLFRRKKPSEALHLCSDHSVLTSNKNKRNILSRRKKKNKAAFPSLSNSSSSSKPKKRERELLAHAFEVEKENAPCANSWDAGRAKSIFDDHHSMSYNKPTLSLIQEEASPRNGEYVFTNNHSVDSRVSPANNGKSNGQHMLSPMSGNKPPLTPNRMRPPTNRNLSVATTNYPSISEKAVSPDASLKGQQILSPHSYASSNDMCLSQDADDEEYNRIAFESASKNASNNAFGGDTIMFPLSSERDPFSTSLPQAQKDDFLPMAHETQEDIRAWTPSPTKTGPSFTFQNGKLLSPSVVSNKGEKSKDLFENFADFEPFDPNHQFSKSSSKSVHNQISPVSALLEDSRARRSKNMDSMGVGQQHRAGSSINSAPVITPSHVRSQVARSRGNSSSISRVIDNLELHVNKRQGSNAGTSNNHKSEASSQHSRRSAEWAIRDAKERIRRENMMNNESKLIDIMAKGGSGAQAAAAMNAKNGDNNWLFDEVTGTLGPRSHAADLESLGGRSNRSGKSRSSMGNKSHRSHRSKTSRSRRHRSRNDGDVSVDSRTSRNSRASYRSYQTTKSMVSQMSHETRSVANDLLRLEAQLSMVGRSRTGASAGGGNSVVTELNKRRDDCGITVTSRDFSISRSSNGVPRPKGSSNVSAMARRAAARSMRSKVNVVAPPGKLGIILANRTDSRGTVVSGVRTSSVLAEQVSPGDRIIAIDDEDVSQMNVKEITTIMARKSEFERNLTLFAAPKYQYD